MGMDQIGFQDNLVVPREIPRVGMHLDFPSFLALFTPTLADFKTWISVEQSLKWNQAFKCQFHLPLCTKVCRKPEYSKQVRTIIFQ